MRCLTKRRERSEPRLSLPAVLSLAAVGNACAAPPARRYDGVWSRDVAKCGLYGAISEAGAGGEDGAGGAEAGGEGALPSLRLLEPMRVLEARAYELQVRRGQEGEGEGARERQGGSDRGRDKRKGDERDREGQTE